MILHAYLLFIFQNTCELFFPSVEMVNSTNVPKRQMYIPAEFQSPAHYKQVFTSALMGMTNTFNFHIAVHSLMVVLRGQQNLR